MYKETLSNKTNVCPNKFTGFPDARLTKSLPLLIFLGAERQLRLRLSGNKQQKVEY